MIAHVLILLFSLYFLFALLLRFKRKDLPPGPTPWPLFGNIPDFALAAYKGKNAVELLSEWKQQFGDVFTIWIGPKPAVNVCDYKTAMDAFVKTADAHTGRTRNLVHEVTRGNRGLLFSDGDGWQEQRRFSLHVLRNFGVGRNLMQQRILEEVDYSFEKLNKQFEESADQKVTMNPADLFDPMVGSIINKMLAGFRFDETNMEKFFALKHDLDRALGSNNVFDVALLKKATMNLPGFKQRLAYLIAPHNNIRSSLKVIVDRRKAQIADGSYVLVENEPNDYIDAYLIEMEKRKNAGESMGYFCEDMLMINLIDLWIAGMETTILTLLWGLIHILNHPEVQEKCRKEILQCTGGNRPVELADKKDLPYLVATITETQRHASILNFNLWHKTTTKTVVGDFVIPEGVTIAPQISVIMSNESHFKDPFKYDPERFFGTKLDQQVIPFSIGKRACLGEGLARAELFLILGNLFQNYKLSVPKGQQSPSAKPIAPFSIMHRTRPFEAVFERVQN
ncbi:hypothetical protein QR680_009924 [Steinernema hermaphroditum]|uniref:CYtochrome P450 family n=1 Tax=Steinernema hermaphroditum TaxID=289476 RepID=A0AA39IP15_9BILA|nr:hypothetical protein QR680_009924 [Steinernema hermaphroditum]